MKINYNELLDFTNVEIKGDTSKIDEILEYEEILLEISKCIKEYRKERGLSQKEFARLLDMDQAMISKLESGDYNPTFKQLHKISRILTNSASLFVRVLEDIIKSINEMYTVSYNVTLQKEEYSKDDNIIYIYKSHYNYNGKNQGGNYETEESTSFIPIAG